MKTVLDSMGQLELIEGDFVRLELLSMAHHEDLCRSSLDDELWKFTVSIVRTPAEMREYIADALRLYEAGIVLPFAIVGKTSGRVVGSTRFGNIDRPNRRAEIGWTWVGREWQRTVINTETKYLLLRHAFENMGCIRVEFKTDATNAKSRKALLRIGATEEGILRKHIATHDGRFRDSVYYSILESEWPQVRTRLQGMIAAQSDGRH